MRFFLLILLISLTLLMLSGCATTRVQMSGQVPPQPLCQGPDQRMSALIVWSPEWRPDQKDALLRETAAQRGIEQFFATSRCFAEVRVIRRSGSGEAGDLSPPEISALTADDANTLDRLLVITVRELGPLVKLISSPALLEGGTEVVLQVRSVSPANGQITADFTTHWLNGGPWVIKGVATLEHDITCALQEALKPSGVRKCTAAAVLDDAPLFKRPADGPVGKGRMGDGKMFPSTVRGSAKTVVWIEIENKPANELII